MKVQAIRGGHVFTGTRWREKGVVVVRSGRIDNIIDEAAIPALGDVTVETLPAGTILAPGFIDVQVNGGGGALLNDAPDVATVRTIVDAHRRRGGTTGMLPTLITDVPEKLRALDAAAEVALTVPGVLGFHLEGPFLNPARKGVHREELIRNPTPDDLDLLARFGRHGSSIVTLAPERVETAAIRRLRQAGLTICAGHCEATFEQMKAAADSGLTGITHLFNALAPLAGRAPGVIGAAFDDRRLTVGLIADGHHVSASNVRLVYGVKARDRIMLVTDAMPTSASDATTFELQGRKITLVDGRLTAGADTLAGAHLTMLEAVRRMIDMTRCDLHVALIMASRTPAEFLGRGRTHGRIAPDYAADMVAFDPRTWAVYATWIGGARGDGVVAAEPQIERRGVRRRQVPQAR